MTKIAIEACLLLIVIVFMGCIAGLNILEDTPSEKGIIAGFWRGLWHGLISPVTFILSLFTDKIHFYEVNNNRNWYNFGFALGAGILFSSSRSTKEIK